MEDFLNDLKKEYELAKHEWDVAPTFYTQGRYDGLRRVIDIAKEYFDF